MSEYCINKKDPGFIDVASKIGEDAAEFFITTTPYWNAQHQWWIPKDFETFRNFVTRKAPPTGSDYRFPQVALNYLVNIANQKNAKGLTSAQIVNILKLADVIHQIEKAPYLQKAGYTTYKIQATNVVYKEAKGTPKKQMRLYKNNEGFLRHIGSKSDNPSFANAMIDFVPENSIVRIPNDLEAATKDVVEDYTSYDYPLLKEDGTANTADLQYVTALRRTLLEKALYPAATKAKNLAATTGDTTQFDKINNIIKRYDNSLEIMADALSVGEILDFVESDILVISNMLKAPIEDISVMDIMYVQKVLINYLDNSSVIADKLFDDVTRPVDTYTGTGSPDYSRFKKFLDELGSLRVDFEAIAIQFGERFLVRNAEGLFGEDLSSLSNSEIIDKIRVAYDIPLTKEHSVVNTTRGTNDFRSWAQDISFAPNVWAQITFKEVNQINNDTQNEFDTFNNEYNKIDKALINSKEYKAFLKEFIKKYPHMSKYGSYGPFLQLDEAGQPTGQLVNTFSAKFYNERILFRPPLNNRDISKIVNYNNWRRRSLVVFDARILHNDLWRAENPDAVVYTQDEIDDHIAELILHMGQELYDTYRIKFEEKLQEYLDTKADHELAAQSGLPADLLNLEVFIEKKSPFVAANKHFDTSVQPKTIGDKTYHNTRWTYMISAPKRYNSTGDLTGFYDESFDAISNIPAALDYSTFISTSIQSYLKAYPSAFIDNYTTAYLPHFQKTNILGNLVVDKEYNKAIKYLGKLIFNKKLPITVGEAVGLLVPATSLYRNRKQDIVNKDVYVHETHGLNAVPLESKDLYIPNVVKAFALATIKYKNSNRIQEIVELSEMFIKNSGKLTKNKTAPDPTSKDANLISAFKTYRDSQIGKFSKEWGASKEVTSTDGRKLVNTDLAVVNVANSWMYATTLGWSAKAAMVQFTTGFQYNLVEAIGGQFINITDLFTAYGYMMPSVAKGMHDLISPVLYFLKPKALQDALENTRAHKIRNVIENREVHSTIAEGLISEDGRSLRFDKNSKTFKNDLQNWWKYTASPTAGFARADYLNQGALFLTMLLKNKITFTDVNTKEKHTFKVFDVFSNSGEILTTSADGIYTITIEGQVFQLSEEEFKKAIRGINSAVDKGKELILIVQGNYQSNRAPVTGKRGMSKILFGFKSWFANQYQALAMHETYNAVLEDTRSGTWNDWGWLGYKSIINKNLASDLIEAFTKAPSTMPTHKKANLRKVYGGWLIMWMNIIGYGWLTGWFDDDDDNLPSWMIMFRNIVRKHMVETSFFVSPISALDMFRNVAPILSFVTPLVIYTGNAASGVVSGSTMAITEYDANGKHTRTVSPYEYWWHNFTTRSLPGSTAYYQYFKNREKLTTTVIK